MICYIGINYGVYLLPNIFYKTSPSQLGERHPICPIWGMFLLQKWSPINNPPELTHYWLTRKWRFIVRWKSPVILTLPFDFGTTTNGDAHQHDDSWLFYPFQFIFHFVTKGIWNRTCFVKLWRCIFLLLTKIYLASKLPMTPTNVLNTSLYFSSKTSNV